MTLHPILAALRKHKAGVALITLQIALTLAIVCNAIFIIGQRAERIGRPTGLDESNLFRVTQQWVDAPASDNAAGVDALDAMQRDDLAALNAMPDVASAAVINALPLTDAGNDGVVGLVPGPQQDKTRTFFYSGDDRALSTLGLRLVAGRAFTAGDIEHQVAGDLNPPAVAIVTQALADKLFPQGQAVGHAVYFNGSSKPSTIVGIVERLQASSNRSWASGFIWNSVVKPVRLTGSSSSYAVRAKPGRLAAAMKAVPATLYATRPLRVLDDSSVRAFADIRAEAYRADLGMAILMGVVCLILLAVTSAGIVGLSSFWVGQRRKQIGVRRALGARRVDIARYFQIENLLIAGFGSMLGVVLAVGLNLWLISHYEMDRLPVPYVLVGVVLVLILGQLAVFVPARRAAQVSPVAATQAG